MRVRALRPHQPLGRVRQGGARAQRQALAVAEIEEHLPEMSCSDFPDVVGDRIESQHVTIELDGGFRL